MTDHIIIIAKTGTFRCLYCEREHQPKYPMPMTALAEMIDAFEKAHQHCVALGEYDDI